MIRKCARDRRHTGETDDRDDICKRKPQAAKLKKIIIDTLTKPVLILHYILLKIFVQVQLISYIQLLKYYFVNKHISKILFISLSIYLSHKLIYLSVKHVPVLKHLKFNKMRTTLTDFSIYLSRFLSY